MGAIGYEMIHSRKGAWRQAGYHHLISNKRECKNIGKNTNVPKVTMLLKHVTNGSYTMMAKPLKTFELRSPMIHFFNKS